MVLCHQLPPRNCIRHSPMAIVKKILQLSHAWPVISSCWYCLHCDWRCWDLFIACLWVFSCSRVRTLCNRGVMIWLLGMYGLCVYSLWCNISCLGILGVLLYIAFLYDAHNVVVGYICPLLWHDYIISPIALDRPQLILGASVYGPYNSFGDSHLGQTFGALPWTSATDNTASCIVSEAGRALPLSSRTHRVGLAFPKFTIPSKGKH